MVSVQIENYQTVLMDNTDEDSQREIGLVKVNKDNRKVASTII